MKETRKRGRAGIALSGAGQSAMNDLNNFLYFARIVEHGSLSAASQALGIAKSALSTRLARLESELGVRLVQRTTRKVQITAVGWRYYEHCCRVLSEVERAGTVIDDERGTPRGLVRIACPVNFAHAFLAPILAEFLAKHEHVEARLDATNEEVDLIEDNYDLVLRIHSDLRPSSLIARSFTLARHRLVAGVPLIKRLGSPAMPQDLLRYPTLSSTIPAQAGRCRWTLTAPGGRQETITYRPRLLCEDLFVLREAVLTGSGIADLPPSVCNDALADGTMVEILPEWQLPQVALYVLYPSRNGLTLAARTFIDHLSERLKLTLQSLHSRKLRITIT